MLIDASYSAILVGFKSYKSRRVARLVLVAEIIAFSDTFDEAFAIRHQLQQVTGMRVPLHLMTDSKFLFDVLSKSSRTSESRLMIDVASAREAYQAKEIDNIGFVRSDANLADGLTKSNKQSSLYELLVTAKHEPTIAQWIMRAPTNTYPPT